MWYLASENDDRIIYIVSSAEIIIGRTAADVQVCNFAITDDPSISRKHASLVISDNSLVLRDLGSRYGTFVNGLTENIESNSPIKLKKNDVVKFGKMNSIWKVHEVNHVTCTSTLKGENLQNLKSNLAKIGGVFKSDWDDTCTYLTMPSITLTIKVVLALAQGSYIVTTDFWDKCIEAVNDLKPLPAPTHYTPSIVESTLNKEVVSFLPNVRRKSLFAGKKIVFFSKRQFEMYKTVLIQSSASPMLLSETRMTVSALCEDDVIVIQYVLSLANQETQAQRNQINDIVNRLKNKGKRVIADAEIGLAILYCSTEKYCNPSFSFTTEVVRQKPEQDNKMTNVLAQETQETTTIGHDKKKNVIIDESLAAEDNKNNVLEEIEKLSAKRKLSEFTSEYNENPNKKAATTCLIANVPNESSKRKLGEDDTASSNPSKKQALNEKQDDDIFNFVNSNGTDNQHKTKSLNLARPQKRKLDGDRNDGLFNFVQTDEEVAPSAESANESMFTINKIKREDSTINHVKVETVTAEDVVAMRGVKLKELMESNISYNNTLDIILVKKEKDNELEEKMNALDLGCTIVITSNDLIVKKEPLVIEDHNTSVRNFKKFKKVWPLKRQIPVVPASSMTSVA